MLALTAIPAVLVFVPSVYGVTLIQGLLLPAAMPTFAVMIVLLLGLLIPHLGLVAKPNAWILPGAAAALAMLALTALARGRVVFIICDASQPLLHGKAPPVPLAAPHVDLLDDGTSDGIRTLRMRITPLPRASLLTLGANARERIVGAVVDGQRVPNDTSGDAGPPAWTLSYWSPPPEGVELTLEVKGSAPLTLTARAATPGLPAIPGASYRGRPPTMMPQRYEDRTLVSRSFTFAARS